MKGPKDFVHKLSSLNYSRDRFAYEFLVDRIRLFDQDDEWSSNLIARTLWLPDEHLRARAIMVLLAGSETILKKVLNASVDDKPSVTDQFETARGLLNFDSGHSEQFSSHDIKATTEYWSFQLSEKTRIRSLQIVLELKLGLSINEIEAKTIGVGSYIFDHLRFIRPKVQKFSQSFLDEKLN